MNGDGINDVTGVPYVVMPGWVDLDGDGICDFFRDANGDGINDVKGLPYAHGFGWLDANGDGINDLFVDANGDGVNDLAVGPYAQMPCHYGFVGPRTDANGDGIDDVTGLPYGHGFGWVDANGDGINDAFVDANGDGINDRTQRGYCWGYAPAAGGSLQPWSGPWPMGTGQGSMMGGPGWMMGPGGSPRQP